MTTVAQQFEVWMEGYRVTGNSLGAQFLGTFEADTFANACQKAVEKKFSPEDVTRYWNSETLSFWGCRMFDNGSEAVKSFG